MSVINLIKNISNIIEKRKLQKARIEAELLNQMYDEYNITSETPEETESKKDDNSPWITVNGRDVGDGRIELECDWNSQFIDYLRKNGFNGANDEVVVQQYLAVMHRQMMEEGPSFD